MLTGRFQLARPATKHAEPRPRSSSGSVRARERPRDAAAWTSGARWLPADDATPEVRYRDPTQMGKVYLRPAGVERPVPGLGDDDQGPDADDPALTLEVWRERIRRHPGRAQEPAAQPGVRRRDRQRLQRRDPPRRASSCRSASARASRPRRSTRSTRRRGRPWRRDRRPARAGPADLREAGPRLPRGPRQGRPAVPALRDAGSPRSAPAGSSRRTAGAASADARARWQGSLRTCADRAASTGRSMSLSGASSLTVVPNFAAIAAERVART